MYFLAKRSSFHSVAEAEVEGVDVREADLAVLEVGVIHMLLQSWIL
jgi:hypothetical protein